MPREARKKALTCCHPSTSQEQVTKRRESPRKASPKEGLDDQQLKKASGPPSRKRQRIESAQVQRESKKKELCLQCYLDEVGDIYDENVSMSVGEREKRIKLCVELYTLELAEMPYLTLHYVLQRHLNWRNLRLSAQEEDFGLQVTSCGPSDEPLGPTCAIHGSTE